MKNIVFIYFSLFCSCTPILRMQEIQSLRQSRIGYVECDSQSVIEVCKIDKLADIVCRLGEDRHPFGITRCLYNSMQIQFKLELIEKFKNRKIDLIPVDSLKQVPYRNGLLLFSLGKDTLKNKMILTVGMYCGPRCGYFEKYNVLKNDKGDLTIGNMLDSWKH